MALTIHNLTKSFGTDVVLTGVSVEVESHTTLSVLGKSGCGKTTLLKIIAGLESPDSGSIALNGSDITHVEAQERGAVYLFQEPLLFPHLTVWDNIAFGLKLRNLESSVIKERVDTMLEDIELTAHAHKWPHALSGGQKQRVAFGRAAIIQPSVLLLDEPFASLDVETRASMQRLFKRISSRYRFTTLFVTHDLKEALLMGDYIAHMQRGILTRYPSKDAFIDDPDIGVHDEINFWSNLRTRASSTPQPESQQHDEES